MLTAVTLRRWGTWLALLAMLWGALAPTLAQAVVRAGPTPGEGWVAVCSVSGMVWIEVASGDTRSGDPSPGASGSQHCPWCCLHGGAAGLPPSADSPNPGTGFQPLPLACYRAPATAALWRSGQSRAPPLA